MRLKRVLVTGSRGFLGSRIERLLPNEGVLGSIENGPTKLDLRQLEHAQNLIARTNPDVIIHCAANCGGIGLNQQYPASLWRDNLLMGIAMLEACSRRPNIRLVLVGTTCSYPSECRVPFREADLFSGYPEPTNAAYGIAKRAIITGALAYRRQFDVNVGLPILANLYGPGDDFTNSGHVIPSVIRKVSEAKEAGDKNVTLWGSGKPTRDFLFVDDAAKLLLKLAMSDYQEPVNIGTGRQTSIAAVAQVIAEELGYGGEIRWDTSKPDGQRVRCLDTSRAEAAIGLDKSKMTKLRDGIRQTIVWYKASKEAS